MGCVDDVFCDCDVGVEGFYWFVDYYWGEFCLDCCEYLFVGVVVVLVDGYGYVWFVGMFVNCEDCFDIDVVDFIWVDGYDYWCVFFFVDFEKIFYYCVVVDIECWDCEVVFVCDGE